MFFHLFLNRQRGFVVRRFLVAHSQLQFICRQRFTTITMPSTRSKTQSKVAKSRRRRSSSRSTCTSGNSGTKSGSPWQSLDVKPSELRLEFTLNNGQCFAWRPFAHPDIPTLHQPSSSSSSSSSSPSSIKTNEKKHLNSKTTQDRKRKRSQAQSSPSKRKGIGKKTARSANLVAEAAARGGGIAFRGIFRQWVLEIRQRPREAPEYRCLNRSVKCGGGDLTRL